jgi:putative ABC transport system substrate-binding protein
MRRRDFIAGVAGAAAWPLVARAQQDGRAPLVGWLDAYDANDALSQSMRAALHEGLAKLGWTEGRNLKVERRFGAADPNRLRAAAAELVSRSPDVIVAGGAAPARALQQATQTIPIVFTGGGDAAVIGLVKNIARPEGNVTGFSSSEPMIGGKWLELLKEAAPHLKRVAVVFNPDLAPTAMNYLVSIEAAAQALAVKTVKLAFHDAVELVRSIDAFAAEPDGGVLMLPPPFTAHRTTILQLAAQHRLPGMYPQRAISAEGGLISYSADIVDQNRRAASYVDRILRGSKVADLPVQLPTKYQLVVNMKTAKALGLAIPEAFLLNVDELIE